MAVHTVIKADPSANLSNLRDMFVARVNAAADRVVIRGEALPGIPHRLMMASVYLASFGVEFEPCRGEITFAWTMAESRRMLDGTDAASRAGFIEEGRKAFFEGRRAIALDMGEVRRAIAAEVDMLTPASPTIPLGGTLDSMIRTQMTAYPTVWTDAERREAAEEYLFGKAVA